MTVNTLGQQDYGSTPGALKHRGLLRLLMRDERINPRSVSIIKQGA